MFFHHLKKHIVWIALCLISQTALAECVVLLHGLARTESSMTKMEKALTQKGYRVINHTYPSRDFPIEKLANLAIEPALLECKSEEKISFVTHSMGGILLRYYLQNKPLKQLNRVVMLGPPNQGSEVVDKLGDIPGFHLINGDAGMQLGTDALSIPRQLKPANFDVGIIAGTRSINLILSALIPGQDDGKVAVENTRLDGMHDHLALPVTHTFMMKNKNVIEQTIHYLRNGEFKRNAKNDEQMQSYNSDKSEVGKIK